MVSRLDGPRGAVRECSLPHLPRATPHCTGTTLDVSVRCLVVTVQSLIALVQNAAAPVQRSVVPVQNPIVPVQILDVPVRYLDVPVQSLIVPVQSLCVPAQRRISRCDEASSSIGGRDVRMKIGLVGIQPRKKGAWPKPRPIGCSDGLIRPTRRGSPGRGRRGYPAGASSWPPSPGPPPSGRGTAGG